MRQGSSSRPVLLGDGDVGTGRVQRGGAFKTLHFPCRTKVPRPRYSLPRRLGSRTWTAGKLGSWEAGGLEGWSGGPRWSRPARRQGTVRYRPPPFRYLHGWTEELPTWFDMPLDEQRLSRTQSLLIWWCLHFLGFSGTCARPVCGWLGPRQLVLRQRVLLEASTGNAWPWTRHPASEILDCQQIAGTATFFIFLRPSLPSLVFP